MQSIRSRITRLTVIAIIIVVIVSGVVAAISLRFQEDVGTERFMSLICETSCDHINERLLAVEQSVITAANYVDESVSAMDLAKGGVIGATGSGISLHGHDFESDRQKEFDEFLSRHVKDVESVFFSIAAQDEGVLSYYYRINPEISRTEVGFVRTRSEGGEYVDAGPTDISAYASNDYAHVGWYYLPQESGRPIWMDPYVDTGQQIEVISYIAPLYRADTFLGVVGIDIAYDSLVEQIGDLEVLSSGYAFLTDDHGEIVYHPSLPRQMSLGDVNAELESAETSSSESPLISYDYDGVGKKAAWKTLENGMRLFVCAPAGEINARSYGLTLLMLGATTIIMFVLVGAVLLAVRRITRPLEDLTEAATQLAEGNYDVSLTYDKNDEVGILTNSFRHLVDNLKVRIADLYNRAYKDALTSVKNKAAYDAYVAGIDEDIAAGTCRGFALAAFDCNEMKHVNDTFGHDKGDLYLRSSCHLICQVFVHSPVFRVGGDEFMCILTDEAYESRDQLVQEFWERVEAKASAAEHEWDKVSLAMGLAVFDPAIDHSVLDVSRRADDLMYQNKNEYKARKRSATPTA